MTNNAIKNTDISPRSQEQQKKIVVSIVLSESAASQLKLNVPYVEDLEGESSSQAVGPYMKRSVSTADSSSSVESNEEAEIISDGSSDEKLKPVEVLTRPLLSVNSTAHGGHIKCKRNNIYISVVDRRDSSDWFNICRICHGGESIGDLLSPCRCRGSIALAHMDCLEKWLKESSNSHCELCKYHYTIVREPRYGVLKSVLVFILNPGERFWDMALDLVGFVIYTAATVLSTYTLSVLCTAATKSTSTRFGSPQIIGFSSVLGIAVIEFTYTSWLLESLKKHLLAWEVWNRNNCDLKVILSKSKQPIKYQVEDSD
ncbi:E3 ubiquitin-protein ligase MARCH3-like isoform X2 [Photinus pyralis]|uniref:E3 ubiquitin-protein ligase MARCH3-like isoform X2 n=1 Tax=Photinus pyralis TaxID=7054 RepID=UPI001266E66D|nr:E3 ubiquitin-protein ligase MARCH3-like isoform X2 [Photinus pyralis]